MPTARTERRRRPSRRSASRWAAPRGLGVSTSTRSPTSGWSRRAARWRASPSGNSRARRTARRGPARKSRLDEERQRLALSDRPSVEPLDREALAREPPRVVDERRQRHPQPLVVGIAQRHERPAAALDEQGGPAAEQDDVGAGDASRACARPLRPRQRGAVGLRRIGGREHERLGSSSSRGAQLAEPLDRAPERELRAAEPLDEVPAPAEAERLERLQLAVDSAVAALDPLGADAVAGDDALPLEQELGERSAVRRAGEERSAGTSGPASRSGGRPRRARSGAAAVGCGAP